MKSRPSDLALLGGLPLFSQPLHVGRPNIGDKASLLDRFAKVLDSGWLTNMGPQVLEFERRITEHLEVRHAIAMCNATVALEIAIRALGMTGEVIIPSHTFIATAHALQWQAITPVFADVDPVSQTIDPKSIERMLTPRTTGIIGVHVWGRPCNIEALEEIAFRQKLRLLFDAAHAFSCSFKGRMIGNFGNAEVLSFHATKFLNTLEGGAVVTNDEDLAMKMRLMQNFGFSGLDNVIHIGTNGKMNEISAAMGIASLEMLDQVISQNKVVYESYRAELSGIAGVSVIEYDVTERRNYQYVVITVDEGVASLTRDELLGVLRAENILARRYFWPGCHRMEPYRSFFPHAGLLLPVTETILSRILVLPAGPQMSPDSVRLVAELVRFALARAKDIRKAMTCGAQDQ